jgi:hypothetical protein
LVGLNNYLNKGKIAEPPVNMSKVEFLQMVPALLYGISMAELALFLGKASRGKGKIYWEHLLIIIFSFEMIIFNWYIFFDRINTIEAGYFNFIIQLCSPLASFIYVANLLVKNEYPDDSIEKYFQLNRKRIFLSMALFGLVNVLTILHFNPDLKIGLYPLIPISLIIVNAFFDLKWLRIIGYLIKTAQIVMVCLYFK